MAEVRSIRSLQLFELLSAPLVAMIQADAMTARAALEFIQTAGFLPPAAGETVPEAEPAGRLRMAEFRYKKLDENNELSEFVASVPVLSLVPIPSLQIKDAKVALSAKITDVVEPTKTEAAPAATRIRPTVSLVEARPLQVMAKPVSSSGAKGQEIRGSYDLDIQISLGQADIASGMEKIFGLMDRAIQDTKAPKSE